MTLEPDELAIREAFDHRRPVAVPPELLARVAAVPGEVRPLRPLPVRLALGVAPWIAIAAAGIVLAFGPRLVAPLPGPGTGTGGPSGPAWTPETTGGLAEVGIFGLPWVPLLICLAAWGAMLGLWRAWRGRPVIPARREAWLAVSRRPGSVRAYLAYTVPVLGIWALLAVISGSKPLAIGTQSAPGPEVSQVTAGYWHDETIFERGWKAGDPCTEDGRCPGPRWVYRLRPGEAYTYIASVRNDGPLPITVLGRERIETRPGPYGLGLLRDPAKLSADPSNVIPFSATTLWPGQAVAIVFIDAEGSCANPAATLGPTGASVASLPGLVYDVLGWRTKDTVFPRFETTVAGCDAPA